MARRGMSYRFCRQGRRAASAGARRQREALRHMEEVMRLRIPRAAKVLVVLTAAALVLAACSFNPGPNNEGSNYLSPGPGHPPPGTGKKQDNGSGPHPDPPSNHGHG